MQTTANHSSEHNRSLVIFSRNQGWENILVEQFQYAPGEAKTYYSDEHSICLSLAPRPVSISKIQEEKVYTGAHTNGDFCLTPAPIPSFIRWQSDDHFLQIRLASGFVHRIANETVSTHADRLELIPEFKCSNSRLAHLPINICCNSALNGQSSC